ncbi:MAG: hypothetical protein NXI24_12070 [bacterium]|nr:hypothetical protein [bacterium]
MLLTAVAPPAFQWIALLVGAYLAAGLIATVILYCLGDRGLGAFDPHAGSPETGRASIGFRVLIFPGMIALWPCVLWRRLRATSNASLEFLERRSREARPLISRRHRINIVLLLIFLPPFYALALLPGRAAGPPLDAALLTTMDESTGLPVARALVVVDLENDFVPRLELELLAVREGGANLYLYTRSELEVLPPDTLLYWSAQNDVDPQATQDSSSAEMASAYLLGPLPAGPGRLPFPAAAEEPTAGRILGYSLAHQQILFRAKLRPVTASRAVQ